MKKKLKYLLLSLALFLVAFAIYFFTIRSLDNKILQSGETFPVAQEDGRSKFLLNTYFVEGQRFYFKVPVEGGDTLLAFGDTGGGMLFLMPAATTKGKIKSNLKTGILKGLMPVKYILFEDLCDDENLPRPNPSSKLIIRTPFTRVKKPFLLVPPMEKEVQLMHDVQPELDIFLGQTFFMDHSWTFDYPNEKIWVNTPLPDSLMDQPNIQKLGFKKNDKQEKLFGHPRMVIEVEGDSLDVLFDTGASIVLTEDGKKLMKTTKKTLGGSFIATSVFEKWRKAHPEWVCYTDADLLGSVIEVPVVKIGDYEVGPVLFAVRKDKAWSEGMIASMDKVVKGAIGGSVLKYFKVTIDYNSELIRFEK